MSTWRASRLLGAPTILTPFCPNRPSPDCLRSSPGVRSACATSVSARRGACRVTRSTSCRSGLGVAFTAHGSDSSSFASSSSLSSTLPSVSLLPSSLRSSCSVLTQLLCRADWRHFVRPRRGGRDLLPFLPRKPKHLSPALVIVPELTSCAEQAAPIVIALYIIAFSIHRTFPKKAHEIDLDVSPSLDATPSTDRSTC